MLKNFSVYYKLHDKEKKKKRKKGTGEHFKQVPLTFSLLCKAKVVNSVY